MNRFRSRHGFSPQRGYDAHVAPLRFEVCDSVSHRRTNICDGILSIHGTTAPTSNDLRIVEGIRMPWKGLLDVHMFRTHTARPTKEYP